MGPQHHARPGALAKRLFEKRPVRPLARQPPGGFKGLTRLEAFLSSKEMVNVEESHFSPPSGKVKLLSLSWACEALEE